MTPRQARRILLGLLIVVLIGLAVWAWVHANTLCCSPPHIVP